MNTPKELFQQVKSALEHKKWAESFDAEAACTYAQAHYLHELGTAPIANEAMANGYRLEGARRVLQILLEIHKPEIQPKRDPLARQNLKPPA